MLTENQLINLLIRLVSHTIPYGYERKLKRYLPKGGVWDEADNYIIEIGSDSETIFAAHLDTVGSRYQKTKPKVESGIIYTTKRCACLGGDDKCGVLCLVALINANVPGTYIFHSGEEVGGIGSDHIAKTMDLTKFKRAVEFDRRGKHSVITDMGWTSTCSDKFAEELTTKLGMGFKPDPTGSFTDVLNYADIIPEVTNISTGYENAHSSREVIDAGWLITKLIPQLCRINWEALPVERDPKECFEWRYDPYEPYTLDDLDLLCGDDNYFTTNKAIYPQLEMCEFCGCSIPVHKLVEISFAGSNYCLCPSCAKNLGEVYGEHQLEKQFY